MWKNTRIFLSLLCLAGFTLLFVDVSGILTPHLAFLGKLQLVPAFLSGSVLSVALLLGLTLVLGRVYCSVLCPLGLVQDLLSRCGGKKRFRYHRGKTALRALTLAVFVGAGVVGFPLIVGLLDPYSAFGRIATDLMAPLWSMGNNALAAGAARLDSFAIAPVPLWQKGMSALVGAALTLGIIAVLAWRHGRLWCNTLCPVGTVLGMISSFALLRPRIRADKCTHCAQCSAVCKASCIDATSGSIDASRCVSCMNCHNICRHGALSFLPSLGGTSLQKPVSTAASAANPHRRALLVGLASSLAAFPLGTGHAAHAAVRGQDVLVPALTRKKRPTRLVPITPPGSLSLKNFTARCTGCQLCVSACPHQALRAQDTGTGMLQPTLSFEHGFCRIPCVVCSSLCPTGAIRPITVAEKSVTQIGRVAVHTDLCIVHTDNVTCTACARICPPGAITLVGEGEHKVPAVDNERCIGCGACEYVCPARPFAAIRVEGNREHRRL